MVNYPWRKMIVPMITGKILHNVILAVIFYWAADGASGLASGDTKVDIAAIVAILFVIIVAYQIEKSRLAKRDDVGLAG
jgi:membrane protein DedA with SNARE-associated domain